MQSFLQACNLDDLHSPFGIPPTANTSLRAQRINFILGTQLVLESTRKGGILSYDQSPPSDHRALFVDLDKHTLSQGTSTDPAAPCQRFLRIGNPEQCKTYLSLVHSSYFQTHDVFKGYQRMLPCHQQCPLLLCHHSSQVA